ncbi:hypothetical protein CRG98_045012 [Punica granatum]|uniref:Uncharacterized protein n=1 Tax=Punica granatum TaxID=22663 RepID=A0A2I0HSC1_PUNGR|nr:hypothetical protein CRG98_045012 [Punica granatum]
MEHLVILRIQIRRNKTDDTVGQIRIRKGCLFSTLPRPRSEKKVSVGRISDLWLHPPVEVAEVTGDLIWAAVGPALIARI